MTPGRRVVVTGIGVVSPIGTGKDAFWAGLMAGQSGVGRITRFDPSGFDTTIAAEVRDFDPTAYMDKKEVRRNDRFVHFAYAAARMALDDAHFSITPQNADQGGAALRRQARWVCDGGGIRHRLARGVGAGREARGPDLLRTRGLRE